MSEMIKIPEGWESIELEKLLEYEQPTKYLVSTENYHDSFKTPVLTAGKTFVLGYTDEEYGIFNHELPVIIFDDFTTASKFVNFPFKAKSSAMKMLKIKDKTVDIKIVYELMQKLNFKPEEHKRHWISTYSKLKINLPKLEEEQQKIAEVLSEVDNAISKTEELFEKNKRIKTALMQDLLNYGIDGNGKIRNPQTHIFKPSELGDIPEEWNCVELGRVCDVRDGTHDSPNYINYGIPFVTSKNLMDTGIDFKNVNYIKEDVHKLISNRSKVENGDILFGMIGTIGKPVIVNTDFEFSIKNVALIKKIKLNFDNIFLLNFLKSNFFNKNVTNIFNGGVQNFISLGMVRKLLILQPEISEQQKIAQILSSQDEKIEDIKNKLNKLKSLKASLMQDLLSGKVRVTKLMEENS